VSELIELKTTGKTALEFGTIKLEIVHRLGLAEWWILACALFVVASWAVYR